MTDATDNKAKDETETKVLQKTSTEDKDQDQQETEKKSGSGVFLLVLFLLVIAAAGLAAYNYTRFEKLQQAGGEHNAMGEQVQQSISALEGQLDSTRTAFAEIEKKLDELESKQAVLKDLIPEPVTETIELNVEFALAEIEHLLSIANYRLQLNHDVATAITAMETADLRLQHLDVPGVLQVREQLIADINSLRSLNQADLSGLGLFLSDLINRVDTLPIQEEVMVTELDFEKPVTTEEEGNKVKEFFSLVWTELKSLVIISRDKNVAQVRLLPDEVYFLRSNIKLELANARFAVFNRDTDNFKASIEHIQSWLDDYFDKSDAAVKNIYESLQRMNRLELAFPDIEINSSIESVRALSHQLAEQEAQQTQDTVTE